ncbi:hypothetical protein V2G26_001969 [Clonostachys chloroleuca]
MLSKIIVGAVAAFAGSAIADSVSCPSNSPLSCSSSSSTDTCCYNTPGGQLLLTQFWDTNPSTGPSNSWTVHGLWPDKCDGTYEEYCDSSREVSNVTAILKSNSPSTLSYMQTYWKDYQGNDESFWEHEFNKHGTCVSSLEPKCYNSYQPQEEVVDYFERAVQEFKNIPTYDWLSAAGIVPSTTKTYTLAQIQSALSSKHGQNVVIRCSSGALNELWYHFNVKGSVQTGTFVPAAPVGSGSTCSSTGIKYLPKSSSTSPTSTTTSAGSNPTGSPGQLSGTGYVYVTTSSASSGGFLVSGGTWYRNGGTPATFTATVSSDGSTFTLKTSKGNCAVQSNALTCSSSVSSPSSFGYDGTYLTYSGSNAFYATSVPSGTTQGTIYTASKSISLQLTWTAT